MAQAIQYGKEWVLDEDQVLVSRFVRGDVSAFDQLYAKYYEKVFSIARGILLSQDDAADAVQEVFTLVYRNIGKFDSRCRFSTWLFRVAVNRTIQEGRKVKRFRHVDLSEATFVELPRPIEDDPKVSNALKGLSDLDRAVLVLYYWHDLSLNEIGAAVGCSTNAAKTRLYRARDRFRQFYEEED